MKETNAPTVDLDNSAVKDVWLCRILNFWNIPFMLILADFLFLFWIDWIIYKGRRNEEAKNAKHPFLCFSMRNTLAHAGMIQWLQIGCLCIIWGTVHLAETHRAKTRNHCSSKTLPSTCTSLPAQLLFFFLISGSFDLHHAELQTSKLWRMSYKLTCKALHKVVLLLSAMVKSISQSDLTSSLVTVSSW